MIPNFLTDPSWTQHLVCEALDFFFNPETLVICDTRILIKKEILPHIPYVGYYDQRILPILKNVDFVISDAMNEDILNYFHSLWLAHGVNILSLPNKTQLTLTENILQSPDSLEVLKNKKYKKLLTLAVDEDTEKLAKIIGAHNYISYAIMQAANDKLQLKNFLISAGLPFIEWISTADPDIIREYFYKTEHYFFKSPQGVSGYGFWSNQKNTLPDILEWYNWEEIIIERVIEKIGSPSIQFCIWWDKIIKSCIFGYTDQILQDWQYYLGNASPSNFLQTHPHLTQKIFSLSEAVIRYIQSIGYIGFWGIDFMIGSDDEVYATEVNARFTGATYPAITSFLLSSRFDMPWRYTTEENQKMSIREYIENSIQNPWESWIFPLCIAPLELYQRVQTLSIDLWK